MIQWPITDEIFSKVERIAHLEENHSERQGYILSKLSKNRKNSKIVQKIKVHETLLKVHSHRTQQLHSRIIRKESFLELDSKAFKEFKPFEILAQDSTLTCGTEI